MNNNILIGHLGWDGCHFLASCLAMSDEVYFNHYTLRGKMEYFFKNKRRRRTTIAYGKTIVGDCFERQLHVFFIRRMVGSALQIMHR